MSWKVTRGFHSSKNHIAEGENKQPPVNMSHGSLTQCFSSLGRRNNTLPSYSGLRAAAPSVYRNAREAAAVSEPQACRKSTEIQSASAGAASSPRKEERSGKESRKAARVATAGRAGKRARVAGRKTTTPVRCVDGSLVEEAGPLRAPGELVVVDTR